jgi:Holliday junction resolvase RusA-like endonuclease
MTVYTFPGEPVPKARPRFSGSGHAYTPARVKEAENAIRWELQAQGARPTSEPAYVTVCFDCKSATSDLDNLLKLVLDAAQGFLFENDRQVVEIHAYLERGAEKPETRMIVETIPVSSINFPYAQGDAA